MRRLGWASVLSPDPITKGRATLPAVATPRRTCLGCGRLLGLLARPDQLHCSARCRLIAFRACRAAARPPAPDLAQLTAALDPHVAEPVLVASVAVAARESWQAAAWLLERGHPERWSRGARGQDAELEEGWPSDAA